MGRSFTTVVFIVALGTLFPVELARGAVSNPFDRTSGANVYFGLNDLNWQSTFAGLNPNAGSDFLATANGNATGSFSSSILKALGGLIDPGPQAVSFFIAKYEDSPTPLSGISFGDFQRLRIGGSGGSMVWLSTPTPVVNNLWVEWRGVYTPGAADVGRPFQFDAAWQLRARTSLAIDGPMTAAIPEPATALIFSSILLGINTRQRGGGRRKRGS